MYKNIYCEIKESGHKVIHLWDDNKNYLTFPYKKYAYKKNAAGTYVSLYGDKLSKVNRWTWGEEGLFESDVKPELRTLIDLYSEDDEPSTNVKTMIIDIEVEVTDGFPLPKYAKNRITSIAFNDEEKYYCLILDPERRCKSGVNENTQRILKIGDSVIVAFDKEADLLNDFLRRYMAINPDIITGWNIDGFDIPYIFNRMTQILGKELAQCLSPIKIVEKNTFTGKYKMAGVSALDYLALYKKFTFAERENYRLNTVTEYELGAQKIEYDGTLNELYEYHRDKFVEYNIQDVRLIRKLDNKLDFINIARGISHVGHTPYEDIYYSSRYLEGALLNHLKKLGIVAPNKDIHARDEMDNGEKFKGAHVQEPQAGKWKWIYDLDITSMYPSIIMSLNISPETKIGKLDGWNAEDFVRGINKDYIVKVDDKVTGKFTTKEFKRYLDGTDVSISANGVLYRTDKQGLLSAILSKWFDERAKYRKMAKKFADAGDEEKYLFFNRRQHLQKILLNSLYGTLGLPVFRFYDLDNSEAVTLTGQDLIGFSKDMTNRFYNMELGNPIEFELENGKVIKLYENDKVTVNRGGRKTQILAKELKNTDDFLSW